MATQSEFVSTLSLEALAIYRRRTFMLAHDHLIVPWCYTALERQARDMQLTTLNWHRNTGNNP